MQDDKENANEIETVLPENTRRELVAKLAKVAVAAPLATVLIDVSSNVAFAS
tara:strand:+ start:389 stop:544 length:156 start_codon:yes stop_codon:yes gene_type:complete